MDLVSVVYDFDFLKPVFVHSTYLEQLADSLKVNISSFFYISACVFVFYHV